LSSFSQVVYDNKDDKGCKNYFLMQHLMQTSS